LAQARQKREFSPQDSRERLLVNVKVNGRRKLTDSHLRRDLDPDMGVEVEVLDLTDGDARALLLAIDRLLAERGSAKNGGRRLLTLSLILGRNRSFCGLPARGNASLKRTVRLQALGMKRLAEVRFTTVGTPMPCRLSVHSWVEASRL
jgi:hypothetical protein